IGTVDITEPDRAGEERVHADVVVTPAAGSSGDVLEFLFARSGVTDGPSGAYEESATGRMISLGDGVDFAFWRAFAWSAAEDHERLTGEYAFESPTATVTVRVDARSGYDAALWEEVGMRLHVERAEGEDMTL